MDLDEAWDSGVYLPTPGANDPPTGYSDFDRMEHPCNDSKFEYALLICNVNEVKDDEFLVCLSGYELGPIKELGVNACGGRFFATSQEIVDVIKREPDEDCPQFDGVEMCCVKNTDAVTIVDKKPFMADSRTVILDPDGNPVPGEDFFSLFMRNTKNNGSNNFGEFIIWRLSKYKSDDKELESLCVLGRGNYVARSGENFGPHGFGSQPLCCDPKMYPTTCCVVGGFFPFQCPDGEKGTPAAEPADECSDVVYPPPYPPPERSCKGECIYHWSESDYKWVLDGLSFCCKTTDVSDIDVFEECGPYDPSTETECSCCPPIFVPEFDGDIGFGICADISQVCALPPERPTQCYFEWDGYDWHLLETVPNYCTKTCCKPDVLGTFIGEQMLGTCRDTCPRWPPEPPPPVPDPNCIFEWNGSDWDLRTDISFCVENCCPPTTTGGEIGELKDGTCQESCPEPPSPPPPTPTCEGGCVYKWELDSSDPHGGYWKLVDLASDCTCICCPPLHIGNDGDIYIGTCQDDSCPDPPSPPPPKDPPSPCGWCAYMWDGTKWTLDTTLTGCFHPCECSEPPYDGTFETEMANGSCSEPPSEPPDDTNVCPDGTANEGQNIPDGETEEWCHTSSEPDDDDDDDDDDDKPTISPVCPNATCAWLFNMDTWSWELIFGCGFHCPGHWCNPPAPLPLDVDISSPDFAPSADTPCFPP